MASELLQKVPDIKERTVFLCAASTNNDKYNDIAAKLELKNVHKLPYTQRARLNSSAGSEKSPSKKSKFSFGSFGKTSKKTEDSKKDSVEMASVVP